MKLIKEVSKRMSELIDDIVSMHKRLCDIESLTNIKEKEYLKEYGHEDLISLAKELVRCEEVLEEHFNCVKSKSIGIDLDSMMHQIMWSVEEEFEQIK